jgi:hypothetical protein
MPAGARRATVRACGGCCEDYGWLTWLGSLPAPFLSLGRLAAFGLATRRLHRADLTAAGVNIVTRRAQSVLLVVLLAAIIVFEVSSILVLRAENASPDANILTAYDALWWGYVTMATVGYGDRYPVTDAGRLVGIAVMTVGVAIFSVLTSFLADWFRRPHTTSTAPPHTSQRRRRPMHTRCSPTCAAHSMTKRRQIKLALDELTRSL